MASYRRYTELPALIHMLSHRELTMLSPALWDDKNDSYFLERYKEKRGLKSVLALCFTRAAETYHHWRVFAPGSSGVRVVFESSRLQPSLDAIEGLRLSPVRYVLLKEVGKTGLTLDELPFAKRYAFKPEHEIRLLWESETEERLSLAVPFDLHAITSITLSPWLHADLESGVKQALKNIPGCEKLRINRSTLIRNTEWIHQADKAT